MRKHLDEYANECEVTRKELLVQKIVSIALDDTVDARTRYSYFKFIFDRVEGLPAQKISAELTRQVIEVGKPPLPEDVNWAEYKQVVEDD